MLQLPMLHYIMIWAEAKAWGEGSENIFAKLDTSSLELLSLLGPVQLDLAVMQHFAVMLKKLLVLLLVVVVVVVVVVVAVIVVVVDKLRRLGGGGGVKCYSILTGW